MRPFNLSSYLAREASLIPNGTSVSEVPNGSGTGPVQITDGGEGQTKRPIADVLGDIFAAAKSSNQDDLQMAAKQAINAEIPQEFLGNRNVVNLVKAIGGRADEDPNFVSRDLETNQPERSLDDLARELAKYLGLNESQLENQARSSQTEGGAMSNQTATPAAGGVPSVRTSAVTGDQVSEEIRRQQEDPTHKRKKSNPFRVLMGYVGKMRDHGMSKREIVKKIMHMKNNRWDPDTIRKCVDIVTERNRRKKKKESTDMSMETLEDKMFSPAFNMQKWERRAKAKAPKGADGDFEDRESVYDQERDPRLMSITELLMEFIYLVSAKEFVPNSAENAGAGSDPDKNVIRRRLGKIKTELKRRGYESNQIIDLLDVTSGEEEEEEQEG
jgi:hypothetical protein